MTSDGAINQAREAKTRAVRSLLGLENVVACGVGYKTSGGEVTTEPSVIVSVARKVPAAQLSSSQRVPSEVQGVQTDVLETGVIRAFQDPKDRMRPARPGVSIGHRDITAGTFGCVVRKGGTLFVLSNNHVLADTNRGSPGDPILQPGPLDGGTLANDVIGTLEEFVPIDFGSSPPTCSIGGSVATVLNGVATLIGSRHKLQLIQQTPGENHVDAAIARPTAPDLISNDILQIGVPTGVSDATLGAQVQKSGRTTGFTQGSVIQVDVTVSVNYNGPSATFTDQLMAGAMSQGGDSGSLVLDSDKRGVGLLFAGSDTTTIINPIRFVLDALGIELVT